MDKDIRILIILLCIIIGFLILRGVGFILAGTSLIIIFGFSHHHSTLTYILEVLGIMFVLYGIIRLYREI
ncbi:MAG: hypothetical protein ACE5K4_01070 [Candidatus Hydrothermarchaeota archaeon]